MKRILFIVFLCITVNNYAQSISKTNIIYERKDQIVLNNGKQYQILVDKPFYQVTDTNIQKYKQVVNDLLRLNRVLILRNNDEYVELVEWVKEDIKLYQSKELVDANLKENIISDSLASPED
ncbi:hypothetical protein [Aquimarina algiphila]|uniref:hypothetical protein n=1 Tax=Aquimarina algiphila TaxID=2047982 RepID=UPI00249347F7|nr:hypothetical protein [Aquimarina algiphila]